MQVAAAAAWPPLALAVVAARRPLKLAAARSPSALAVVTERRPLALALRVIRLSLLIRALPLVLKLQGLEPPLQLLLVLKVQGLILRAQCCTFALQVSSHLLLGLHKFGLLCLEGWHTRSENLYNRPAWTAAH